jgi:hypothetical protein
MGAAAYGHRVGEVVREITDQAVHGVHRCAGLFGFVSGAFLRPERLLGC